MPKKEKTKSNISASVRARLYNLAKESGRDFNAVVLQYFQERFLYRLSRSTHRQKFVLKGALLFLIYEIPRFRPTKDIDFLGYIHSENVNQLQQMIKEINMVMCNDGVQFDIDKIKIENITEENEYHGFRIKFKAFLGTIQNTLQLDIGIGDVVVPDPLPMDFPTLLEFPNPKIKVYSKESVIAEKFQAAVRFNILTSRMKDFYDILYLANHHCFHINLLHKALVATFQNRHTRLEDRTILFQMDFKQSKEKQEQWTAFLSRNHLESIFEFSKMMVVLEQFIEPVCSYQKSLHKDKTWNATSWKWIVK
ncbi:nucleotidyl transferase AbiEii/AbiGii toxin family protein [candidate division KSB1 bacterium]|nr:nucleotidyl transferase AbiEii/AbiGii toxin family protein [candidate division KSB1 bacterium]